MTWQPTEKTRNIALGIQKKKDKCLKTQSLHKKIKDLGMSYGADNTEAASASTAPWMEAID